MNTRHEKTTETPHKAIAHRYPHKGNATPAGLSFADHRPEAALQAKWQATANGAARTQHILQMQKIANAAPARNTIPDNATAPPVGQKKAHGTPKQKNLPFGQVIQGYFTQRARGGLAAFMAPTRADKASVDNTLYYLDWVAKRRDLVSEFLALDESNNDEGTLEDWINENLDVSLGEINHIAKVHDEKIKHPQTREIPDDWISFSNTGNLNGPPFTITPPFMGGLGQMASPFVAQQGSHLLTDISTDNFTYRPPRKPNQPQPQAKQYPITDRDRSDVRSGAMLTNSYVDYLERTGQPKLTATSTQAPYGNKTVGGTASELTAQERTNHPTLYPDPKTIVGHHPDKVWTGTPESRMGFHPISKNANTLEGDKNNLTAKVASRSQLSGMLVRDNDGQTYRPTLKHYNDAKQHEMEVEESMDAWERMQKEQEQEVISLMLKHRSTEIVSKMTGLSEEEVAEIYKSRHNR